MLTPDEIRFSQQRLDAVLEVLRQHFDLDDMPAEELDELVRGVKAAVELIKE